MRGITKILFAFLIFGLVSACGGQAISPAPSVGPTAGAVPTSGAAATSGAVPATDTPVAAAPTQAALVATAVPPTVLPTVQPSVAPTAAVRIAVQLADNSVILVDQSGGKSLAFKASNPADLASISGIGNVLGDKLYLALSGRTSTVVRVGANGPQTLDWIKGPINGFAVSAKYLAWGKIDESGAKPVIQIMLSALDGSGVKTALSETVGAAPIVLKPLRWSFDGTRLFFGKEPSGIGGYILFGGFTNLWTLDPVSGKASQLLPERAKNAFVCMDDLSPL